MRRTEGTKKGQRKEKKKKIVLGLKVFEMQKRTKKKT